uniref:MADS42 n=1 Tax=Erycina pusilla TaxID=154679 RepID=A0A1L1WP28_9ASPA|nr:MADS42 [Erycina pusilla]
MGRAKLEIKYLQNSRARRATYLSRIKGLKKKAVELSLLCGVDVLSVSVSVEPEIIESWPNRDTIEFRRIRDRYISYRMKESNCSEQTSSIVSQLLEEEITSMKIKLKEVRERLCLLRSCSQYQEELDYLQTFTFGQYPHYPTFYVPF